MIKCQGDVHSICLTFDGPLCTITVRSLEWTAQEVFHSFISLPVFRDDDPSMVCYNGSLMQTVQKSAYPRVLYTEPLPGDPELHEVLLSAFTDMSSQFESYITSISGPCS